jgi:hypothetical protein
LGQGQPPGFVVIFKGIVYFLLGIHHNRPYCITGSLTGQPCKYFVPGPMLSSPFGKASSWCTQNKNGSVVSQIKPSALVLSIGFTGLDDGFLVFIKFRAKDIAGNVTEEATNSKILLKKLLLLILFFITVNLKQLQYTNFYSC